MNRNCNIHYLNTLVGRLAIKLVIICSIIWGDEHGSMMKLAFAHHPSMTSRVTQDSARGRAIDPVIRASTYQLQLNYLFSTFRHTERRSTSNSGLELGSVDLHVLDLSPRLRVRPDLTVALGLELGQISRASAGGERLTDYGLGDLRSTVTYDLVHTIRKGHGWQLSLIGGVVAPTGDDRSDHSLSATGVRPDDDGMLTITRYSAQASMGSGAWSSVFGFQVARPLFHRLLVSLYGEMNMPFTRTDEGVLWGRDDLASLSTVIRPFQGLRLTVEGTYRAHRQDQLNAKLGNERSVSGERQELLGGLGVAYRVSDRIECSAYGRLPLWRRADMLMLMESYMASVGCLFSWSKASDRKKEVEHDQ